MFEVGLAFELSECGDEPLAVLTRDEEGEGREGDGTEWED